MAAQRKADHDGDRSGAGGSPLLLMGQEEAGPQRDLGVGSCGGSRPGREGRPSRVKQSLKMPRPGYSWNKMRHSKLSLRHVDYFKVKIIKTRRPFPNCLRVQIKDLFWNKSCHQRCWQGIEAGGRWGTIGGVCGPSALGPRVCVRPSKHLLTHHLLFYLRVNCIPPFEIPKPLSPTSSLGFSER